MPTTPTYRTNHDLFSNCYLEQHLPETGAWDAVSEETLREKRAKIRDLWERERETVCERSESSLQETLVEPLFRILGIPFEVERTVRRGQRRPDYGFFPSAGAARRAFTRKRAAGGFYRDAVAVAEAKRWGRPLDTCSTGEYERDSGNPSYQIHVSLQETPARWAVLTNGRTWRLYHAPTSHRLDSYYEIDLPAVLDGGDLAPFKYFYLFFRHEAFLEETDGDAFLDAVYDESAMFARELGEELQDNVYRAITVLAEGFFQHPANDLDESDLELIRDSSLVYLYRLVFVLYAESEGRDLLDTSNEIYEESYSLNALKREVAAELDSASPAYRDSEDDLRSRLETLFVLIDNGSEACGIPEEDLYVPAYRGGLFRTDPDEDGSREARFLATHAIGDAHLARVIGLLTRSTNAGESGTTFVDYSSLDVRRLGSIYEGALEYTLRVADEPLALSDDEYVALDDSDGDSRNDDSDEVTVGEGEVYLVADSGERKATGSYYTPEYLVEHIVENALEPLVDDVRQDIVGRSGSDHERGSAEEFAERICELTVLDPAMGSGHFLTSAVDYLAREIVAAQEREAAQQGLETVDPTHDINWARREVARRCIYGVDLSPLAVELAKASLWLRTFAGDQPLALLDHRLKTGNSLVGSTIEAIEQPESTGSGTDHNASPIGSGSVRTGTLDQLPASSRNFIATGTEDYTDIEKAKSTYDAFEQNDRRQRLMAMANVRTADAFGLDQIPGDAYGRMAAALAENRDWRHIETTDWFQNAQARAQDSRYFHWRLEYPEVFSRDPGREKKTPGFDAVIGNPPWVITADTELRDYLRTTYRHQSGQPDLYRFFIERCMTLTRRTCSLITPSSWLSIPAAAALRNDVLGTQRLQRASAVSRSAFEGVDSNMATFVVDRSSSSDEIELFDLSEDGTATHVRTLTSDSLSTDSYRITLRTNASERQIVSNVREGALTLGDISDCTVGYQLYHSDIHDQAVIDEEAHHSTHPNSASDVPEIRSSSLFPYYVDPEPDGYVDSEPEFFRIPPERFRNGDRILIREITGDDGITAAAVDRELLFPKSVVALVLSDDRFSTGYVTALLNSTLLSFEFLVTGEKATQALFPRLSMSDLDRLTVRRPPDANVLSPQEIRATVDVGRDDLVTLHDESDDSADFLAAIAEEIQRLEGRKRLFDADLSAYLGSYRWGEPLAQLPECNHSPGVTDTILSETTATREKLHIDAATVTDRGSETIVSLVARYKPAAPDEYETDTYGYTTTDPIPALEFVGLSERNRQLVEKFVPFAVSEARGFANFRDNATKRNSLLDRISALTLPAIDDVSSAVDRYAETCRRHEQLEAEIRERIALVDEIVYELYGLSDEEIAIVEDAVTIE